MVNLFTIRRHHTDVSASFLLVTWKVQHTTEIMFKKNSRKRNRLGDKMIDISEINEVDNFELMQVRCLLKYIDLNGRRKTELIWKIWVFTAIHKVGNLRIFVSFKFINNSNESLEIVFIGIYTKCPCWQLCIMACLKLARHFSKVTTDSLPNIKLLKAAMIVCSFWISSKQRF